MFDFVNLASDVRSLMLEEISADMATGRLFLSPRLTDGGVREYPDLLIESVKLWDDDWLATQFRSRVLLKQEEQRRKPKGGYSMVKVPWNAPEQIAEGEWNRYYARAICLKAIANGISHVKVYRAKAVEQPRAESERLIGTLVPAKKLLDDLRSNIGIDTALGIPGGPNSGISVRLP